METMSGHQALDVIFKDGNIETCTFYDINMWRREYNKEHPYVFVRTTRDDLDSVPSYFYYHDHQNSTFYKQYRLFCPICEDEHFKYPLNDKYKKLEKYYKIQKLHEKSKYGKGESVE